jgi:hypothetical protein
VPVPRGRYTARRFLPFALRRLMAFLPPAVLIRFRKPCSRFCLRLLFCAVVSDIVVLLALVIWTDAYYNQKQK